MANQNQDNSPAIDTELLGQQVEKFGALRPHYRDYARLLEQILTAACDDFQMIGIVGSRVKSIPSFTEKCIRKYWKYKDPVNQITDLCGARVILHTRHDVARFDAFVRKYFRIDEANSVDVGAALRPSEFGYRSVHFIVQLDPQDAANCGGRAAKVEIPSSLLPTDEHPFKAEIQIRTIAQHAWADIGHDRIYKSKFDLPRQLRRKSARVAALLEDADEAFERLVQDVDAYRLQYNAYMTPQQLQQEIKVQQTLLQRMPEDERVVRDLARLFLTIDDCPGAISALESFAGQRTPALTTSLGHALCRAHGPQTGEHDPQKYARGKLLLAEAATADPPDHNAIMHLADVRDVESDNRPEVLGLYQRAFQIDPSHPRALGGYLETTIREQRSLEPVLLLRPMLEAAVEKCRRHAEVGVHLPDALYRAGEFLLFLDRPFEALAEYTRAIARTNNASDIESALLSLKRVSNLTPPYEPIQWARQLLWLAKGCKFDGKSDRKLDPNLVGQATSGYRRLNAHGPVVIVAGGCDPHRAADMQGYADLLQAAFDDFRGVIISGGTEQGISGLIGDIGQQHDDIVTIGYLPAFLPTDATKDTRYKELRTGIGDKFNALQPLRNWIDLISDGVSPENVCVLGINGGVIAGFEYRLACAWEPRWACSARAAAWSAPCRARPTSSTASAGWRSCRTTWPRSRRSSSRICRHCSRTTSSVFPSHRPSTSTTAANRPKSRSIRPRCRCGTTWTSNTSTPTSPKPTTSPASSRRWGWRRFA